MRQRMKSERSLSTHRGPEERAFGLRFDLLTHKLLTLLNNGCGETRGSLVTTMGCFASCRPLFTKQQDIVHFHPHCMHQSCSNQTHYIPVTPHKKFERNKAAMLAKTLQPVDNHIALTDNSSSAAKRHVLMTRAH